jgi:glycosyltransferase involved in cell wall biosynthesis
MDYVIVTYQDKDTIANAVDCIRNQCNINKLIVIISDRSQDGTKDIVENLVRDGFVDEFYPENVGLAFARQLAIEVVNTEWFVFVDADVELCEDWAIHMYSNLILLNDEKIGAIFGCLYRNEEQEEYLCECAKIEEEKHRMYTHNTMIKTELVKDWIPPKEVNAYEDYLLTQHIIQKGYKCFKIPVISFHNHSSSTWKEATWAGAGAKCTGYYKNIFTPLKYLITSIYGGLKRTIRTKKGSFLKIAIIKGFGNIWGYLRSDKYRRK